jgi:hypothetical protein
VVRPACEHRRSAGDRKQCTCPAGDEPSAIYRQLALPFEFFDFGYRTTSTNVSAVASTGLRPSCTYAQTIDVAAFPRGSPDRVR